MSWGSTLTFLRMSAYVPSPRLRIMIASVFSFSEMPRFSRLSYYPCEIHSLFAELQLREFHQPLQPCSSSVPAFFLKTVLHLPALFSRSHLCRLARFFNQSLHPSFILDLTTRQLEFSHYGPYILMNIPMFVDEFWELHELVTQCDEGILHHSSSLA